MKIKFLLLIITAAFAFKAKAQTGFPFDKEVRDFKHADSLNMPAPGGILFIGSSSIRMWSDLEQRFAGKNIVRRGLGGSQLWQWVQYYAPYVVYPYKPSKIFLYAGENDIASGKTPEAVAASFETFWQMLRDSVPQAEIYYLGIKPSPSRARFAAQVEKANVLVKASIANKPHTHYINVSDVIMNKATGQADSSLFRSDYLHLNSKGYDRWQQVLQPYIK